MTIISLLIPLLHCQMKKYRSLLQHVILDVTEIKAACRNTLLAIKSFEVLFFFGW